MSGEVGEQSLSRRYTKPNPKEGCLTAPQPQPQPLPSAHPKLSSGKTPDRSLPCLKPFVVAPIFFGRNTSLLTVVPRPNFIPPSFALFSFQFFIMPAPSLHLGPSFSRFLCLILFPAILRQPQASSSGQPSPKAPGLRSLILLSWY